MDFCCLAAGSSVWPHQRRSGARSEHRLLEEITSDPRRRWIEPRAIEFVAVAVGDPNGATLCAQDRLYLAQFAGQLLGAIRCDVRTVKDQAILPSAFVTYHKIKNVVRHQNGSSLTRHRGGLLLQRVEWFFQRNSNDAVAVLAMCCISAAPKGCRRGNKMPTGRVGQRLCTLGGKHPPDVLTTMLRSRDSAAVALAAWNAPKTRACRGDGMATTAKDIRARVTCTITMTQMAAGRTREAMWV